MHRFVENQGDAWTVTGAYLDRFIDDQRVLSRRAAPRKARSWRPICGRIRQIGRRTGEMQSALASRPDIPDFAPEPISRDDIAAWTERLIERSSRHLRSAGATSATAWPKPIRLLADRMLASRDAIAEHIRHLLPASIDAVKIRHHGDFHLGQVLVVKDDAFILDFEGEPGRSLAERRAEGAGGARRRRA